MEEQIQQQYAENHPYEIDGIKLKQAPGPQLEAAPLGPGDIAEGPKVIPEKNVYDSQFAGYDLTLDQPPP